MLSSCIYLGIPNSLLPSGFLTKILYEFLASIMMVHASPISSSLIFVTNIQWRVRTTETPYHAIFSSLLLLFPSYIQTLSLVFYSQHLKSTFPFRQNTCVTLCKITSKIIILYILIFIYFHRRWEESILDWIPQIQSFLSFHVNVIYVIIIHIYLTSMSILKLNFFNNS